MMPKPALILVLAGLMLSACSASASIAPTPTPIIIYVTPAPTGSPAVAFAATPSYSPTSSQGPTATPTSTPTPKPTAKPTPRPTINVYAAARTAYLAWVAKWKPALAAANAQLLAAYGLAESTAAYGKMHQVFVGYRSGFINLRYPSACLGQRNYVVTNFTKVVQALANAALAPDIYTLIGLEVNVNSADDLLTVAEHDYKLCIGITS